MATKISDVMHTGVETHAPDALLTAIAKTMKEKDIGAVPIVEKGQLVGIITDRDITTRALANGKDFSRLAARDAMTTDVEACLDTDSAEAAVKAMQKRKVRRLPVLNQRKQVIGMVSLGDITHALPEDLSGRLAKSVSAHHA